MKSQPTLEEIRAQIAELTTEIIELAGRRNELALEVGRLKVRDSLAIENADVEANLAKQVIDKCEKVGLDRRAGLKIMNALLVESKRVQGLPGVPEQVPTFARALELQRKGVRLVRLDVGEPDFAPPTSVVQACSDALFAHRTHYTESRGIPELREALRGYLARKHRFRAADDEVAVTPSGRFAVYAALAAVVSEGESAVVLDPNWPAYRDALQQIGARAIVVGTKIEDEWAPSVETIKERIRPDTRAIVVSFPSNPTGYVPSARLFREIIDVADDRGIVTISDEPYNEYSFKPCPSILETTPKKFILTSSFSKSWAMTGFRIGYTVSSKETIANVSKLISLMFTSVPEFIQWGAIKALDADEDVKRNVEKMRGRVDAVCKELDHTDSLEYVPPDGGMYLFPRVVKQGETGDSFAQRLLSNGVSVVPGSTFGGYSDFFRISLGQRKELLLEGVRKMGELLG